MKKGKRYLSVFLCLLILFSSAEIFSDEITTQELIDNRPLIYRQMEALDRGLVAIKTDEGVFLSWRLYGNEDINTAFNLYRDGVLITQKPLTGATNYIDKDGNENSTYQVAGVLDGVEEEKSKAAKVLSNNYMSIPLDIPQGGRTPSGEEYTFTPNDCSVGDLDGDGTYEIVVKWEPTNAKDNSQGGYTGPTILDAYTLDGKKLWRIDLGINIRSGPHYTQFMVYDLDGDGKAEVACKTADGTIDGKGKVIGDKDKDYRNSAGYVLDGPEYLTVFSGETGEEICTVDYYPPRGNVRDWGDNYGNRVDRFLAGIAYLDGVRPSLIMCRGYYTRTVIVAYNFDGKNLEQVWVFDTNNDEYKIYAGRGNHNLSIGDYDYDGCDEITYGSIAIDHDGKPLYNTGLGHGDALHVSDFIPSRPGLEVFAVHESDASPYGAEMRDARTGEIIFGRHTGADTGRGMAADVDPRYPGAESWAAKGLPMMNAEGETIVERPAIAMNFAVYWDGDLLREMLSGVTIEKWDYINKKSTAMLVANGCEANNGSKSTPCLSADILGDWREEVIFRTKDNSQLRIYISTYPTDYKIYTLMHDPMYRLSIAWQNVAYNQPPHTGFYLGYSMKSLPAPLIYTVKNGEKVQLDLTREDANFGYPIERIKNPVKITIQIDSYNAKINDSEVKLDSIAYIDHNSNRTMLPVRFVSEGFGCLVFWDEASKSVTILDGYKNINIAVGENYMSVNNKITSIDQPAVIVNGRTYLPLRALAEALGKNITYDERGFVEIFDQHYN